MIRINLLPVREARRRADVQQQLAVFGLVLAASLGAVGWTHWAMRSRIADAEKRVVETEAEIKKYDEQLAQVEAYKAKKKEVQDKLDVIHGLERSRSGPVHMLDELAVHTPERMWLTKLEAKSGKVTISGMSLDNEIVAMFLTKLNDSAYFDRVELGATELDTKSGFKLNKFEVSAMLDDPNKPKAAPQEAGAGEGTGKPGAKGAKAGKPGAKPAKAGGRKAAGGE
jgi:type IV pilus assembly protein PilN